VLSKEQKHQFNRLLDYRDQISDAMFHIETTLKGYFPEEFNMAYQHYIPQIVTALDDDPRWLSRGQINMQYTINRILDKINRDDFSSGVSKFIK
jgi:soluble cytochrome b562